jgi:hypothetical protein
LSRRPAGRRAEAPPTPPRRAGTLPCSDAPHDSCVPRSPAALEQLPGRSPVPAPIRAAGWRTWLAGGGLSKPFRIRGRLACRSRRPPSWLVAGRRIQSFSSDLRDHREVDHGALCGRSGRRWGWWAYLPVPLTANSSTVPRAWLCQHAYFSGGLRVAGPVIEQMHAYVRRVYLDAHVPVDPPRDSGSQGKKYVGPHVWPRRMLPGKR